MILFQQKIVYHLYKSLPWKSESRQELLDKLWMSSVLFLKYLDHHWTYITGLHVLLLNTYWAFAPFMAFFFFFSNLEFSAAVCNYRNPICFFKALLSWCVLHEKHLVPSNIMGMISASSEVSWHFAFIFLLALSFFILPHNCFFGRGLPLRAQSCPTLWSLDYSPPGCSVHGVSGKNSGVSAIPSPMGSSLPQGSSAHLKAP